MKKLVKTKNKSVIRRELFGLIDTTINNLKFPQRPATLYDPIRYTLNSGGKRIRPYLTLLSCGMMGGSTSDALYAASAIELLHNFTLVHDDIMDKAEIRRGKPTVHKKWDEATAILVGDYLFAKSFDLINYYGEQTWISKKQYVQLHQHFLKGVKIVCEGQVRDMELEKADNARLDDYLDMISCKTSALLSSSLQLGGIIADCDQHSLKYLGSIGVEIGNAFQIQDDLLDITGNPDLFGKTIGGDIKARKKTYLSILAFKRANKFQKLKLLRIFNDADVGNNHLAEIVDIYNTLDVIEDAKRAILFHYESAIELIDVFDESTYKMTLLSLLKKLINRRS